MFGDIKPTEEHFLIMKELGTKWVTGLITMNAALFICILTNYKCEIKGLVGLSLLLLGVGAVSALAVGYNVIELFLRFYENHSEGKLYYEKTEKIENREINGFVQEIYSEQDDEEVEKDVQIALNKYNFKIKLLRWTSIYSLGIGSLIFIIGAFDEGIWQGVVYLMMLLVALFIVDYIYEYRYFSRKDKIFSWIIIVVVIAWYALLYYARGFLNL